MQFVMSLISTAQPGLYSLVFTASSPQPGLLRLVSRPLSKLAHSEALQGPLRGSLLSSLAPRVSTKLACSKTLHRARAL